MSLLDVLEALGRDGITLSLDGASLRIAAPKGALTAEHRARLGEHRDAIVAFLREAAGDDGAALPTLRPDPAALHEPFPLSDLQLGFYMADDPYMEFHVRPHYYIEKNRPGLDVDRYEAAWNRALARHAKDIVIVRADGRLQTIDTPVTLTITRLDWHGKSAAEIAANLATVRADMMRAELPLDRWPWVDLRVSLWHDGEREQARVHYNHNNFFSDGYGTTRLLQEIDALYADPALLLPPIEIGFRDAALALEQLADSPVGQRARRYWDDRLPTLPAPPALPQRAGMNRRCRSTLNRREGFVSTDVWAGFKAGARAAGLTPSNAVFAAYVEVLATWSGSRHFVLANMMTRRLDLHPEMRAILGNFASLYPLEIDLRERTGFADSARRLQEQVIRDARHLALGGMRVMQAMNRGSDSFGRAPVPFVIGSGLFMDGFERADFSCLETSQVMLDHQFWEQADGSLYFVWDLLEDFFPAGMIDAMWAAYLGLVARLAAAPDTWHADGFDLVPAAQLDERRQPPADAFAHAPTRLGDFLPAAASDDAARAEPHARLALAGAGTEPDLDWPALARAAGAIAAGLLARGLRRGDRVAIVADRSGALLQAVHGVMLAGGAYVPVDPALPAERRAHLIGDSGAQIVLATRVHAARTDWPAKTEVAVIDDLASHPHPVVAAQPGAPGDLAYVLYTSGSTGRPKGVMIDHRGAVNTVLDINARYGVGPRDRLFGVSSFGFDLSVYDLFGSAAAGAAVVYPEPAQALNPAHWLDRMLACGVTVWNSAPALALLLAEAAEARGCTLPALRLVLLSGDWIPVELPDRLRRIAPGARIVSLGGATEASIWSIVHDIDDVDPMLPSIPYGRPLLNQRWHVLDELGRPAPVWVPGELHIGGIGLALGYWNDPGKTAAAFIDHPRCGERLYRTGDIGRYLPGGSIEFLGRKDFQVKIQGHRIELGEIETVLATHPSVQSCVVVVQPARRGPQLAAHVVCAPGAALDAAALRAHLATRLPDYMLPRQFGALAALPITANGKIDRKALPLLDDAATGAERPRRFAPASVLEQRLLALWQQVLELDAFGLDESFFDLGGQSFEAVRLVGLVKDVLGVGLTLGDIWEQPTIEALAARIERQFAGRNTSGDCAVTVRADGAGAPLHLVHPAGGQVLCYRHLAGDLDRPVRAFQAVGLDGHAAPLDSVPAMAARYLGAIDLAAASAASPAGLLFGGWSSGGPIAFDMARQAQALGHRVAGVVIFDSPAPLLHDAPDDRQLLAWFLEDLALPADLARRAADAAISLAVDYDPGAASHAQQATTAAPDEAAALGAAQTALATLGAALPGDPAALAGVFRVFKAVVRANRGYRPEPTALPLLVIRALRGSVSEFERFPDADRADWGWSRFTTAPVALAGIDATHAGLLEPGAAAHCARLIEAWVARAPHSS